MSEPSYEHVTYRVEWVFKLGWIGDSEGRTWAKDMKEETVFPTQAEAQAYRDTHPDMDFDTVWKEWKAKHCYGLWAIEKRLAKVDIDPAMQARLAAAEAMAEALRDAIRWAHDTLWEINPENYSHDEVCKLNDASVEVILGLAVILGEKHGKSDEWWQSRAARAAWEAGR
jgi:hypothetical protein